ncbi:hypothetical protein L596_002827 [Steinernema carpocapsae]|uniref:Uncharacterized protein n=1 Tax=Steinernema carpocapsae TaxID=34508 RepID=A0A4U8UQP6_STECR|nr:hypothetical protein L596_002827 [Steinernema carpocapsae]
MDTLIGVIVTVASGLTCFWYLICVICLVQSVRDGTTFVLLTSQSVCDVLALIQYIIFGFEITFEWKFNFCTYPQNGPACFIASSSTSLFPTTSLLRPTELLSNKGTRNLDLKANCEGFHINMVRRAGWDHSAPRVLGGSGHRILHECAQAISAGFENQRKPCANVL